MEGCAFFGLGLSVEACGFEEDERLIAGKGYLGSSHLGFLGQWPVQLGFGLKGLGVGGLRFAFFGGL